MMHAARHVSFERFSRARLVFAIAAAFACGVPLLPAQPVADPELPFALGERLVYRIHAGVIGTIGKGTMAVEGPMDVRGIPTYQLTADFRVRVAWMGGFDRSATWLDPERMAVLRSETHEKHAFSDFEERVNVFPAEARWATDAGRTGTSPTAAPLDELAFIYYVRTMPLAPDSAYRVDRHYDPARNPVEVRVLGTETVRTGAGDFATIVVEMRVKDPRRFEREGIIRLNLTDDDRRIPVRIRSAVPALGTAVFTLESMELGGR